MEQESHNFNNYNDLGPEDWVNSSQIDGFTLFLATKNQRSDCHNPNNPFGSNEWNHSTSSIQSYRRSSKTSCIPNINKNHVFILVANANHWAVLINIIFPVCNNDYQDEMPRTKWFLYDTLNIK